jgi:hypothetical protein
MTIRLQCQCGTRFRAKDSMSGKTVRCPMCQASLQVLPSAQPVSADDSPQAGSIPPSTGSVSQPAPDDNPWAGLNADPPASPPMIDKPLATPKPTSRIWTAFAAGAGGGIVCLAAATVIFLALRSSNLNDPSTSTPQPRVAPVSRTGPGDVGAPTKDLGLSAEALRALERTMNILGEPMPTELTPEERRVLEDPQLRNALITAALLKREENREGRPLPDLGSSAQAPPRQGWNDRVCQRCKGSGRSDSFCQNCRGTGVEPRFSGRSAPAPHGSDPTLPSPCQSCKGTRFGPCFDCRGTGKDRR